MPRKKYCFFFLFGTRILHESEYSLKKDVLFNRENERERERERSTIQKVSVSASVCVCVCLVSVFTVDAQVFSSIYPMTGSDVRGEGAKTDGAHV